LSVAKQTLHQTATLYPQITIVIPEKTPKVCVKILQKTKKTTTTTKISSFGYLNIMY